MKIFDNRRAIALGQPASLIQALILSFVWSYAIDLNFFLTLFVVFFVLWLLNTLFQKTIFSRAIKNGLGMQVAVNESAQVQTNISVFLFILGLVVLLVPSPFKEIIVSIKCLVGLYKMYMFLSIKNG